MALFWVQLSKSHCGWDTRWSSIWYKNQGHWHRKIKGCIEAKMQIELINQWAILVLVLVLVGWCCDMMNPSLIFYWLFICDQHNCNCNWMKQDQSLLISLYQPHIVCETGFSCFNSQIELMLPKLYFIWPTTIYSP